MFVFRKIVRTSLKRDPYRASMGEFVAMPNQVKYLIIQKPDWENSVVIADRRDYWKAHSQVGNNFWQLKAL